MAAAMPLRPTAGQGSRTLIDPRPGEETAHSLYQWLMSRACGDPADSHVLASPIAARASEPDGDLADLLGLDARALDLVLEQWFPEAAPDWRETGCLKLALHAGAGSSFCCGHCGGKVGSDRASPLPRVTGGEVAGMEEECEDIRALLLEHAAPQRTQALCLASILARTCLRANHLWEDLGLRDRGEVLELMRRNFPSLAALNAGGRMRWKKFFYRQLCKRAQIDICRSPNCGSCDEYPICFSPEQTERDQAAGLVWTRT